MTAEQRPALRVVRGQPDDAELAAVVVALLAARGRRAGAAPAGPATLSAWVASARTPGVRTRADW